MKVASTAVCPGHSAPLDFLTAWVHDRPPISLVHGPRGGGKSYLAAFATHLDSVRHDRHATRILGGSLAQSEQIFNALGDFARRDTTGELFASYTKTRAVYTTGSEVAMLAASPTSVRGPHVPTLRLDEVDEIDPEIREAAFGMCMARDGIPASVAMTSTWHRVGGPMAELLERGVSGEFPFWRFCVFEVLEPCPTDRSGAELENCPGCPLVKWCHDVAPGEPPKAKRSKGHYAIDSLIQKARGVSTRVFEADYLCTGPKADGLWFPGFDRSRHVSEDAEYDPELPVCLAVDPGVVTGAVLFQHDAGPDPLVTVFADYLSEGRSAESNALALKRLIEERAGGRCEFRYSDPAGGARNPIGPTVLAEYRDAGLPLRPWANANPSVADGLETLETLLNPAAGRPRLVVHPRCKGLIEAFRGYRRAKRAGQWMDYPEDPQHPHEDLMDALRGGLYARIGNRRTLRVTSH